MLPASRSASPAASSPAASSPDDNPWYRASSSDVSNTPSHRSTSPASLATSSQNDMLSQAYAHAAPYRTRAMAGLQAATATGVRTRASSVTSARKRARLTAATPAAAPPTAVERRLTPAKLAAWVEEVAAARDTQEYMQRQKVARIIQRLAGAPRTDGTLELHGKLVLRRYKYLTSLPPGLWIRANDDDPSSGSLNVSECDALRQLSPHMHLEGALIAVHCDSLTDWCGTYRVDGCIDLRACANLRRFVVTNLNLSGHLSFDSCPQLQTLGAAPRLGARWKIGGSFSATACPALTSCHGDWRVGEDVDFNHCSALTCLPQALLVEESLLCANCEHLQLSSTNHILVKQYVDFENCRKIRFLPPTLLTGDALKTLNLQNCGLTREYLAQLEHDISNVPIELIYDRHDTMQLDAAIETGETAFKHLSEAYTFWQQYCGTPDAPPGPNPELAHQFRQLEHLLEDDELQDCLYFASILRDSRSFTQSACRPALAQQMLEFFRMLVSERPEERALSLAHAARYGGTYCADRGILQLEELYQTRRIQEAQQTPQPLQSLEALARGFLGLQVVDHLANKLTRPRQEDSSDESLESVLDLRIRVAKALHQASESATAKGLPAWPELPITARHLSFARYSEINRTHVHSALQAVQDVMQDTTALATFLQQWEPYQQTRRQQQAATWQWNKLPKLRLSEAELAQFTCVFTQAPVEARQAVLFYSKNTGAGVLKVRQFDHFVTHWINTGRDAETREELVWEELYRLPRRRNAGLGH